MGVLDKVLKKRPSEEELQAKEDSMMKSSEERYEEEAAREDVKERKSSAPLSTDRDVVQLQKDIELLKVQMELMKQGKQVSDERFSKISEQIGEIRATVLDSEREGATIKMQAEKAIELIQLVQPEKLMNEVKKVEVRIEETKGIEEKLTALQQKVMSELKDLRQRTEVIRGSETLLQLNEEVRGELSTAMQIQAKMEQRADKVEAMFVEFQQHFNDYQRVFDRMHELDAEFKGVMKDFAVFKVKIETAASRVEFARLKNELKEYGAQLDEKIIELDKSVSKAEMAKADILKDVEQELADFKKELTGKITAAEDAKVKLESLKPELLKAVESQNVEFKRDFDQRLEKIEEELDVLAKSRKEVSALAAEVQELSGFKEELQKRVKQMEGANEELLQKIKGKIEDYSGDVKDNTAVIRDLVKELYSLKTHSANMLTKSDVASYQKSVNDKLIAFDMALMKLDHQKDDLAQSLRSTQRDLILQQRELQKEVSGRLKEFEGNLRKYPSQRAGKKDVE